MSIVEEDIGRVREASDIVAIVSGHTMLRKVGARWTGLCPFHQEKSPSFSVNQAEGLYHCFGCKASGDVITFVREIEHLDFVGAIEWLASRSGVTLRYTERDESEQRRRAARQYELIEQATQWYHDRLLTGPDAGAARRYLRSRGFDREMVERYRLGWAPDDWDALARALRAPTEIFSETGLGFLNRRNRVQDFFRGRILFPIFDERGRPVAFGGRKLPDADGPKYQNSREHVLYNKGRTLYGLNWAKADMVASDEVIVCEGYTDVIGFFNAGLPRAVATCGTALTEDHIAHLERYTKRIVLAFDADAAGQAAAERVYEWERRHSISLSVLTLPPGTDPDELARSDPEALRAAVAEAQPYLGFRISRIFAAADLRTPEGRARAAEVAIGAVAEHPDDFVRDAYVMEIYDRSRVDDLDRLRLRVQQSRSARSGQARAERHDADRFGSEAVPDDGRPGLSASRPEPVIDLRDGSELEALRMLAGRRDEIEHALVDVLFTDGPPRQVYRALAEHLDVRSAIDARPELASVLHRLSVEESMAEVGDVVARLARETALRAVRSMESQARLSDTPLDYAPSLSWLKLQVDAIDGDEPGSDSVSELVAWLTTHAAELGC